MKNIIDQLALGKVEYDMPDMEFSVSQIVLSLKDGEDYEGFFQISTNHPGGIKGLVYSDRLDIQIVENAFVGKTVNIYYKIHASISQDKNNANQEEIWRGALSIVSNAGEGVIPYEIHIENASLQSSIGEIRDLYHFANLVQLNNEEAMHLFCQDNFVQLFLKDNLQEQAVYESVKKNANMELALEEFLLAVNKKKRVQLEISDTRKEYSFLTESYGDCVVLTKSTWGYISIDVKVEGDFLVVGKHLLTSEDFAGSNYEFHYLIDYEKCADGMNHGIISFQTIDQRLELHIIVDNGKPRNEDAIQAKKDVAKLMDMYLQFRLRQYPVDKWMRDSMDVIEHIRGTVDDNNWVKLVQAQILLTQGKDEEARFILDSMEHRQRQVLEQDENLYGYYLYVRTLEKQESEFTRQTVATVKKMYENGYASWQLLWVLSYLDDSLEYNKSLKLLRIKEEFNKGCTSPLMYYEALDILNNQPEFLRMLNDFEIQVLYFGHKRKAIGEPLARQIVELSLYEKKFRPLLYKILCGLYESFENTDILSAICGILIRGNIHRHEDFKWFELGVERGLKIAGLYESYMYSINTDNMLGLPKEILMYFSYNSTSFPGEKMAYLYSNILYNKYRRKEEYEKYLPIIEQYAMEQMMAGNINEFLVRIYREILNERLITSMIAKRLPDILKTCCLECANPNVEYIHVAHKEFDGEQTYPLVNGKAYFPVYTEDAVITLNDRGGNRILKGIEYKIKPLFQFDSLLKKCYEECKEENPYLLMYFVEKFLKYHSDVLKQEDIFEKMLALPQVKDSYRQSILEDVIDYYVDRGQDQTLDNYLASLDLSKVKQSVRVKVIELMIARGLYKQVYDRLANFGIEGESPRRILKFCSRYIGIYGEQEDEFLTQLCMYAFRRGKYDENILMYLNEFYYGNSKDMIELWKACDEFGCECSRLEERIIVQLIFTRGYSASMQTIFASYYDKRIGKKLVSAYLTWKSYEYFVKEAVIEGGVFIILEKELSQEDRLSDICKLAYLKYKSEKEKPEPEKCKKIEEMLHYLCKKGYLFSFYKSFVEWCRVPYHVIDQTVLEYRCAPGSRVYIHYLLDDGGDQEEYTVEEMQDVYAGIYTKTFTLFYGENIDYYITEENSQSDSITQSDNLNINFREQYENDSRFGLLNDMMVCREMNEEVTLRELMETYMEQNALTEALFKIR